MPASIARNDWRIAAITASSAANAWIRTASSSKPVAVRWNGQRWTASVLPPWVVRIGRSGEADDVAAAISARNVWNFSLSATQNPAMAARYNGHCWVRAYLPGEPTAVSALSASDIWAVGPSRKTMSKPVAQRVYLAMH